MVDDNPEFLAYLHNSALTRDSINRLDSTYLMKEFNLALNLFLPIHSHFPRNYNFRKNKNVDHFRRNVEKEVVECVKTVFVARSDNLEVEYNFLSKNYPWHKFYKGTQVLSESPYGVAFRSAGNSRLPYYYKSLVETGIQGRIEKELVIRKSLLRKPAAPENVKKFKDVEEGDHIGLGGAFSTFFVVWGAAVPISLPAFVFEVRCILNRRVSVGFYFQYFKCLKIRRTYI